MDKFTITEKNADEKESDKEYIENELYKIFVKYF